MNIEGTRMITELPRGEYTLEANRAGFRTTMRPLKADGGNMTVVVGLEIAEIEATDGQRWVKGKVPVRPQGLRCRYVRLIPVYTNRRPVTARLSDEGAFAVLGLGNGVYFAVVFGDGGMCSISEVKVPLLLSRETEVSIGPSVLFDVQK